jgi:hypothetical protein
MGGGSVKTYLSAGRYYEKQADVPKGQKFEAVEFPFAASPAGRRRSAAAFGRCEMKRNHQIEEYCGRPTLRVNHPEHTPYNKRAWEARQVNARAAFRVCDYDGTGSNPEAWTEINLTEITDDKNGNAREKVIAITLNADERKALIALLTGGAA